MKIKSKQKQAKEIFDMVYAWGRNNIKANYKAPAFQQSIYKIVGFKSNGWHKVGASRIECFDPNCKKKKHLPF